MPSDYTNPAGQGTDANASFWGQNEGPRVAPTGQTAHVVSTGASTSPDQAADAARSTQPAGAATQPVSAVSPASAQAGSATAQPTGAASQSASAAAQSAGAATQPVGAPVQPQNSPYASFTPSQYTTPAEPKKTRWWVVALIILGVFLLLAVLLGSCVASMFALGSVQTDYKDNTIAVIQMDGTMDYDGTANSPEGLKELLDIASDNDNIKAIVLRVNSGGGTAAAGEEMSTYLKDFDKPVVVSSAAINASAAYMISSQADYIYVLNSTDIGAIGTLLQHYNLSELLEKLGINIENIKSADSKDSSYYNRPLTDEERERYQHLVDQINEYFIKTVAEGRDMKVEEVRKLADGMTWVGQDSVDVGLADEVGTFEDACAKAAELAGCPDDYDVDELSITYSDLSQFIDLLGQDQGNSDSATLEAIKELIEHDGTVK